MLRLAIPVTSAAMVVLFVMAAGGTSRATTDQGSPAASPQAGCTVEPRTYDELVALVGVRGPDDPSSERPGATALPAGDPVDAATHAQIVAAAHRLIACGNSGNPLQLLALYSDRLLRSNGPWSASNLASLATPEPYMPPARLGEVRDVLRLPDGRVSAILLIYWHPNDARPDTRVVIFVLVDGNWLLDETYEDITVGDEFLTIEEALGTPIPQS